ncbi:hypothetical protein ACIRL2_43900 [Embleya sp. NPDC127516]
MLEIAGKVAEFAEGQAGQVTVRQALLTGADDTMLVALVDAGVAE